MWAWVSFCGCYEVQCAGKVKSVTKLGSQTYNRKILLKLYLVYGLLGLRPFMLSFEGSCSELLSFRQVNKLICHSEKKTDICIKGKCLFRLLQRQRNPEMKAASAMPRTVSTSFLLGIADYYLLKVLMMPLATILLSTQLTM